MNKFVELLKRKIIVFDGSFGALMRSMEIPSEDYFGKDGYTELLNLSRPDIISKVTEEYFKAGSDVVQTCSYSGSYLKSKLSLANHTT